MPNNHNTYLSAHAPVKNGSANNSTAVAPSPILPEKRLSRRTQNFTDSVIRRMTRIANRYGAINLSQGFPDWDPPVEILQRLREVADIDVHQYSTTWGAQNLREAIATKQSPRMGWSIDPDSEIIVTCGSTEAMMCAMMSVADPGDEVIIFSPFYENYGADSILSGAVPIYVPLRPPSFDIDEQALRAAFARNPKAIVVCNPSNPCGKVFTREELELIVHLAQQHNTLIITDEVYEHIVFEPAVHTYAASLPGARERTISCSSLSKTYSITGWRLGYVIAPAPIADRIKKVHDFLTVGAPAPLQEAAVVGLQLPPEYYEELLEKYTRKRDILLSGLDAAGLSHSIPQGTYFVLVDIGEFNASSDIEFCERLARDVKVAGVPGSSFFAEPVNNLIRFHFDKNDDVLKEAVARLSHIREKMR